MWNQNDKVEIENAIQYACSDVRNWTFLEVGAWRTIVYRKIFVDALKARGEDFQFFSLVTNQEKYLQVEEMYREEEKERRSRAASTLFHHSATASSFSCPPRYTTTPLALTLTLPGVSAHQLAL